MLPGFARCWPATGLNLRLAARRGGRMRFQSSLELFPATRIGPKVSPRTFRPKLWAFANRGLRLARNMGSTFPGFPPFLVKGELDKETQAEEQQRGNRGGRQHLLLRTRGKINYCRRRKPITAFMFPSLLFDASVSLLLLLLTLECQLYEQTEEDRQGATHQR